MLFIKNNSLLNLTFINILILLNYFHINFELTIFNVLDTEIPIVSRDENKSKI